jgi:hypothetical protein
MTQHDPKAGNSVLYWIMLGAMFVTLFAAAMS